MVIRKSGKAEIITFLMIFIGAIIAIAILTDAGNQIAAQTTLGTAINESHAVTAANVTTAIQGRSIVGTAVVINSSNSVVLGAGNFTVDTRIINGVSTVALTPGDNGVLFAGSNVNVSYTFQPDGFVSDPGGRAIVNSILIFGALAIVVFIISMLIIKTDLGSLMMGR